MKPLKNKPLRKVVSLTFLTLLSSTSTYGAPQLNGVAGNKITICHLPKSDAPKTKLIHLKDWNAYQGQGDILGACGILADEGVFSDGPMFYALSDDTDQMSVYKLGTSDVFLASDLIFPDELENLTEAQGGTYYALTAKSSGKASLYEITVKQQDDCSFTTSYSEVFNHLKAGDFNALELIDG
jgi:hypothetical protein